MHSFYRQPLNKVDEETSGKKRMESKETAAENSLEAGIKFYRKSSLLNEKLSRLLRIYNLPGQYSYFNLR